MTGEKYIGLDVHQATISVAVMDCKGKVVMEVHSDSISSPGLCRVDPGTIDESGC